MDPDFARVIGNPYASPSPTPDFAPPQQPAEPAAPQHGSLAIIFPGFFLLLVGYFASNVFAIGDLYGLGFGPHNEPIPSPLAEVLTSPSQRWLFYGITAAVAIAGCVMVGSQNFSPSALVCYVLCPLVGLVFLVATPLRLAVRWATPIASLYLAAGTCLAGAGVLQLVNLYGQRNLDFQPLVASLMTEAGLALIAGGALKLLCSGAPAEAETPAMQGSLNPAQW